MRKRITLTLLLLIAGIVNLYAQGSPCGDSGNPDDPTDCAPLDTWVILLVIAALLFATWHLHKMAKADKQLVVPNS